MHADRLRWLIKERKTRTLEGATELADAAPDILRQLDLGYDATQDEINDLRRALVQTGHAALASNEELGIEWIRYAKRVIRHVALSSKSTEPKE